jgi:hypothetical protein
MARGELPELTSLVYEARENCLDLVRRQAEALGAECVIGNRLLVAELGPGLVEVVALGTALRRADGVQPQTQALLTQAAVVQRESLTVGALGYSSIISSDSSWASYARSGGRGRMTMYFLFLFLYMILVFGATFIRSIIALYQNQ